MQQRLLRSRTDRIIGGVCAGLGQYLGIDPVIVRLIFIVLAVTTFLTPLIYPVLWLIMPEPSIGSPLGAAPGLPPDARYDPMTGQPLPPAYTPPPARASSAVHSNGRNRTLGFVLAGVGVLVLIDQIGDALAVLLNVEVGNLLFPLLLVGIGIFLLRKQSV